MLQLMRLGTAPSGPARKAEHLITDALQLLCRSQYALRLHELARSIFGDFSGHADGERRGLDRVGGRHRKGPGGTKRCASYWRPDQNPGGDCASRGREQNARCDARAGSLRIGLCIRARRRCACTSLMLRYGLDVETKPEPCTARSWTRRVTLRIERPAAQNTAALAPQQSSVVAGCGPADPCTASKCSSSRCGSQADRMLEGH